MQNFSKSKILAISLVFFILGIGIGSIWQVSPMVYAIGFILALATLVSFGGRGESSLVVAVTFSLFFSFLAFLGGLFLAQKEVEKLRSIPEGKFQGKVWISKVPQKKEEYQKIVARPIEDIQEKSRSSSNKTENQTTKIKGQILLFAPSELNFHYGEVLEVSCDLEVAENKYPKFNYRRFLAKDGIYQICRRSTISKTNLKDQGNLIFRAAFWIRNKLEEKNNLLFPQPESAYLAGLLLGGEDRLPAAVAEAFRKTGTTHTVAVSGSNIAILIAAVVAVVISLGLSRRQAFWMSLIAIAFFVIMIGAPASAVRAALMGGVALWAAQQGRLSGSVRAALLAAAIMVAFSPFTLLYDAGFQLSFLATLGIIFIYAPLSGVFNIKQDFLEIKSILLLTVSAQLGVTGLILYSFETFSPWSLLANLVILPAIPLLMLGGFAAILLSFISLPVAGFLSSLVYWGLHWEISFIQYLAQLPYASLEVKNFSLAWLVGYYAALVFLVIALKKKVSGKISLGK
jgi:competence protein ComEC